MACLLGPQSDIVDVQGVGQDRFDEGLLVHLHLLGQGGEHSGATLAPAVDDHPATGTAHRHNLAVVHVHLAAFSEVQLAFELGHCFPGHGPVTLSVAADCAPDSHDVGIDPGQFVKVGDLQMPGQRRAHAQRLAL